MNGISDILEDVTSIIAEVEVLQDKVPWGDAIKLVLLSMGLLLSCSIVIAAGFGAGPLSAGGSVIAGVLACVFAIFWFINTWQDIIEMTEEMLKEQLEIIDKIKAVKESLGITDSGENEPG